MDKFEKFCEMIVLAVVVVVLAVVVGALIFGIVYNHKESQKPDYHDQECYCVNVDSETGVCCLKRTYVYATNRYYYYTPEGDDNWKFGDYCTVTVDGHHTDTTEDDTLISVERWY